VASIAAVYAQYQTLFGRDPGVALLALFLGLKLMEMRARRDAFVLIFLCFFLLLTTFFHSQSIATAAMVLAAVLALVATMLTMQYGPQEAPIGRRFRTAAMLLAQAAPVAAVLFVLFPRIDGPLWSMPSDAFSARTSSLSDTMSPGQISSLALSDEVAFRVRFEGAAPPVRDLYWRGPVLSEFDGRTWRRLGSSVRRPPPQIALPGTPVTEYRYVATLEPHSREWIFALETPTQVPQAEGHALQIESEFDAVSTRSVSSRLRYSGAASPDLRIGLNETAATLHPMLQLPASGHPRARALAAQWQHEEPDAVRRVQRVLDWFAREPFRYTLRPPLLERDPVDEFLFGTRAGFCEHFSSAFVVLMRAMQIPARVVTGYHGAESNPASDYWIVRQGDAHAWAEVWLPGLGWVRVDPTAAVAPERVERGSSAQRLADAALSGADRVALLRHWRLNFDALTHAWNQWLLSYDRDRQQSLLSNFGLDSTDWPTLVGSLAAVLALALGAIALLTLRAPVPRDPVERAFEAFCERIADIGAPRRPHETAIQYLYRMERLLDPDDGALAREIVSRYNRLRYDSGSASPAAVRHLQRLIRSFNP
ncbi:MAG TPA: DUF3488 and transglutaminase-like domain-containing protein, partial [Burkholderiaceae bacterium]|nr:DUF3488 and transglutaminase-like domain-containing protein [Burkholderiaceae bacterium]